MTVLIEVVPYNLKLAVCDYSFIDQVWSFTFEKIYDIKTDHFSHQNRWRWRINECGTNECEIQPTELNN